MEGTWSSCWTVTSTCHGAWESICLWTLLAGFTTCTARASSTETLPPRYRVLMLLHVTLALWWHASHFYFHGKHWNSPSSLRCWVIQKSETAIMSLCVLINLFLAELPGPLWKWHIHCCGGRLWPGWKDPWLQVSLMKCSVLSRPTLHERTISTRPDAILMSSSQITLC